MLNVFLRSRRKDAVLFLRTSATFLGGGGGEGGVRSVAHGSAFFEIRTRAEDIVQSASNYQSTHAPAGPIAGVGEGCDFVVEVGEEGGGEGV